MAVIRSDGRVSDGAGDHAAFACSYLSFDAVAEAMEELRALSAAEGYYFRTASGKETYNLAQGLEGGSSKSRADNVPTGVALPYKVTTRDEPTQTPGRNVRVFSVRKGPDGAPVCPTHATAATLNALAKALSGGTRDSSGVLVPKLSEGWLPQRFGDLWQIVVRDPQELGSDAQKEEWGQGAARAVQAFNLGVQIDPLKLLRGDPIQLGTSPSAPHHGHALFCFAARRYRGDEVRFLALGSQLDTFGVGVRLSDLARSGILTQATPAGGAVTLEAVLLGASGGPLGDHPYALQIGGRVFGGRSDATGRLALSVPAAGEATLSYRGSAASEGGEAAGLVTRSLAPQGSEQAAAPEGGGGGEGQAGAEWVVSKSSRPFQHFVYRPGPLQSGRSVTHAYRFGRWQVLRKGEADKHQAFGPWRGEAYAARLFHEFPRYPLRLAGSNDPDYITPEGHAATLDVTTERYYRNTERLSGGYFPIGRSRVWHNGVHFEPDEPEGMAYAPLDGRVVAARLADPELKDDAGEPRFPFGSGNFVLLKHALELGGQEHEFFSLLMHLGDPELRLVGDEALLSDRAAQLPWLRELALAPDSDAAKDEAASLDWQKLYLKVWKAPSGGHALGDAPLEAGDLLEVAPLDLSEGQWRTAHGMAPGPVKRVSDGAEGTIDPAAINADGGLIAPYDAFPSQFSEVKEKLLEGEVVDLWEHELVVRCGEPIGHLGTWQGAARLHFEIFSESLIPVEVLDLAADPKADPSYVAKAKVDYDSGADAECFFDRASFLEQAFAAIETATNETLGYDGEEQAIRLRDRIVGETTSAEDRELIREQELQRFFNQPRNSLAPVFRNLVVRHLSEWGTKVGWEGLRKAAQHLGEPLGDRLEALGKQSAGYAWWSEGLGQEAGLPQDQVAHFYHPVTFLAWIERARQAEVPKGSDDALHTSALELNTDVEGPAGGGEAEESQGKLLRLRICDDQGVALEGARYELQAGEESFSGEAGPGGLIEHEVSSEASEGQLEFWPAGEDESRICPLRIK